MEPFLLFRVFWSASTLPAAGVLTQNLVGFLKKECILKDFRALTINQEISLN
jgi:hypothetical protein